MKRRKISNSKSRKMFSRTASKKHKRNSAGPVMRGGGRL